MRHWVVLILFLLGLGALRVIGCGDYGDEGCGLDACEGVDCNDGNPCTVDTCFSSLFGGATCEHDPVPDGTGCSIDGIAGACVNGQCDPCAIVECRPDGNECTTEYCNRGECLSKPVTDGTACSFKGLFPGVCVSGLCGKDLCEGVECDDGDACTVGSCDYVDGSCEFTAVACDDGNACTEDACDPADGCVFIPVEDGTPCGGSWPDWSWMCEGSTCVVPCDWRSEEESGCPIEGLEDRLCCPGSEYCRDDCDMQECETHEDCNDENRCTEDRCDYVDGTCDFTTIVCDDHNECTTDACDAVDGCIFVRVEDGRACGTPGQGVCRVGACVAPCEPPANEAYPCPVEGLEDLFCCPGSEHCRSDCTAWVAQDSGTTNTLEDVLFIDVNTGTAVGHSGTILRTTDGGATWTAQDSGSANALLGVSFTDANNGTAVGWRIVRTTDGGATWVTQSVGAFGWLDDVSFTDANTGTAVGNNGTIVRTTDAGETWVTQDSGTTSRLNGVSFTDANTGTAVGDLGTIVRTTDGGATWVTQDSGTANGLFRVSFVDANTGTAVGGRGTIVRTTNGGETWVTQDSGTTINSLHGVWFTDADTGTVVGYGGTILRTTDGGTTWVRQDSGTTVSLEGVSFTDTDTGTVVGRDGIILRTTGWVGD